MFISVFSSTLLVLNRDERIRLEDVTHNQKGCDMSEICVYTVVCLPTQQQHVRLTSLF